MLLSCGDALVDFLPVVAADGRAALVPVAGGSCLNVAVGMARLGAPAGFVGGLSTDLFGRLIADHAEASHVDLRHVTRSAQPTTLAFVRVVGGEPQYAFYNEGTASRRWRYVKGAIAFAEMDAVHVGSTTLVDPTGAEEMLALLDDARGNTSVSFDPNCRPNLVQDTAAYVRRMHEFAARADIVRVSDGDFAFLYGEAEPAATAEELLDRGGSIFVLTCGARGAVAWHAQAGRAEVAARQIGVVDTIGAGDSFQAGLLFALRTIGCIARASLACMSNAELHRVLTFATACAALTCGRVGADPPRLEELDPAEFRALRG